MGRHRRSARATADEAVANARQVRAPLTSETAGVFEPEDPAEAVTQPIPIVRPAPTGTGRHRSPHRPKAKAGRAPKAGAAAAGRGGGKPPKPAPPARRAGLLGASAAVAMGAVAVVSGLLPSGAFPPGGEPHSPGSGSSGHVLADAPPEAPPEAPVPPPRRDGRSDAPADRADGRDGPAPERETRPERDTAAPPAASGPMASGPAAAGPRSAQAEPVSAPGRGNAPANRAAERPPASSGAPADARPEGAAHAAVPGRRPAPPAPGAPRRPAPHEHTEHADHDPDDDLGALPGTLADTRSSAAHLVLSLVNAERAKAGCRPLRVSGKLSRLAQAFSDDMARRGFFDHTDPDGRTPWDRAARRGIKNLGGENIARGHPDAHTVMEAWMRSSGHRANILNCDYRSIGVGVHHGGNGPYWTQDFGY
ncbi:CAP domain-containing protein [Streptomyces sp. NPDC037389]|uniref:CAP domain-containing protein n=1 Tax=Streptomyces sp. NPDC037389 TaxID=3155369 RepID=UPI0033C65C1B